LTKATLFTNSLHVHAIWGGKHPPVSGHDNKHSNKHARNALLDACPYLL
jgi:hypothetical protein